MYTYANLKDDLTGLVGGVDLAKIQNLNQLVSRAARNVIANIDPEETKKTDSFLVYKDVFDYTAPTGLKKVVDFGPQSLRSYSDSFSGRFSGEFDKRKRVNDSILSVEWKNGVKNLRVSKDISGKSITLSVADSTSGVVASSDAENIVLDTITKYDSSGSLRFDLSGAGTAGGLEKTITPIDLTDHDEVSDIFIPVYFSDFSRITSVTLRWGNSNSVYWESTKTSPHFGSFVDGWNLIRFTWDTEVGTVDPSSISYLLVSVIYDGDPMVGVRVGDTNSRIGVMYDILYYSNYLFRSSAGTWSDSVSSDSDIINLDTDGANILLYECEVEVGKQLKDDEMKEEATTELYGTRVKEGLYRKYLKDHPSEEMKRTNIYYRV